MILPKEVVNRMIVEAERNQNVQPSHFIAQNAAKLALSDSRMVKKWIFRAYGVD